MTVEYPRPEGLLHNAGFSQVVVASGTRTIYTAGQVSIDEQGALVALEVKEGDRILFGKWSGTEVKLDGEELLIMKESDIMGIVDSVPAAKKKAA